MFQMQLMSTADRQDTLKSYKEKNESDTSGVITEINRQQRFILNKLSHINRKQLEIIEDTKTNQDLRFEEEFTKLGGFCDRRKEYSERIQKLLRLEVSTELITLSKELFNKENFLSLKSENFDEIIKKPVYVPSPQGPTEIYGEFLTNLENYILVYSTGDVLSPDKEFEQRIFKREQRASDIFEGFSKEKLKQGSRSAQQLQTRRSVVDLPVYV